jgi:hypothetical protein
VTGFLARGLRVFKAALNVVVAEVQTLDDPRDLTEQLTAQTGFYTHRGLDDRTSSDRPGVESPATPPPAGTFRRFLAHAGLSRFGAPGSSLILLGPVYP